MQSRRSIIHNHSNDQKSLLKKFLSKPDNFSFEELKKLLIGLGYEEITPPKNTYGQKYAFINNNTVINHKMKHILLIQKPYMENRLKEYQIDYILNDLKRMDVLVYKDFIGSVFYHPKEHYFYGKVEGTNDLITFEGKTLETLTDSFRKAVENYLEVINTTGKESLSSFKGGFSAPIKPAVRALATTEVHAKGISFNELAKATAGS